MNQAEADMIASASVRNRPQVSAALICGCFYCLATFPGNEVREWVDGGQTALCPRCGIDSVLPSVTDETTLRSLRHHRFETTYPLDPAALQRSKPERATGE